MKFLGRKKTLLLQFQVQSSSSMNETVCCSHLSSLYLILILCSDCMYSMVMNLAMNDFLLKHFLEMSSPVRLLMVKLLVMKILLVLELMKILMSLLSTSLPK